MIVVSDTSPLNYLVLIEADRFLPNLFGQVVAPPAVVAEMRHSRTPGKVMDERDGSAVARQLGLIVVGTLGVLELAAERGLLSLPAAMTSLCRTTFRAPAGLIAEMLRRDRFRKPQAP